MPTEHAPSVNLHVVSDHPPRDSEPPPFGLFWWLHYRDVIDSLIGHWPLV